jgi:hypothetical protein
MAHPLTAPALSRRVRLRRTGPVGAARAAAGPRSVLVGLVACPGPPGWIWLDPP